MNSPILLKVHHEDTYLKNPPMNWALKMKGQAYSMTLDELIRVIIDYERRNPGQWLSVETVEQAFKHPQDEAGANVAHYVNPFPRLTIERLRELPHYDKYKDAVPVKHAVGVLCSHGKTEVRAFNWD